MAPFVATVPVRFADVDHAGIVYYPRFFHYFHITFEEFFRSKLGARGYVDLLDKDKVGFPSVHAECDYKSPLRFGDDAQIAMSVARLGQTSVTFRYVASRVAGSETVLCAEGSIVCAVVDLARFVPTQIPLALRNLFLELTSDPI